jgi:hypothetical protein
MDGGFYSVVMTKSGALYLEGVSKIAISKGITTFRFEFHPWGLFKQSLQ